MKITRKTRQVNEQTLRGWLARYEQQYDMTTEEFLEKWRDGTSLDESPDYVDWAMHAKALELIQRMD